ncbi:MAG TPA: ATP-binding protein, partial [Desulfobaccales bacterium]|nr:ATP-binding protein [Desulfobaccales bacterium]
MDPLIICIFAVSALLQFVAAFFAFRLIRVTGFYLAWILIAAALCGMAVRRLVVLGYLLSGQPPNPGDWQEELVALVTSIFMLAGVLSIAPLFRTIKEAEAALRRSRDELEGLVVQRTEELREANAHLAVELEERRQAEYRLAQYASDLSRSNAELEQFAYVASHDLQEPLRMVASFTQLLAKRYRDKLDQDAADFINFAVDGATRMQTLINDLLAYSRVGTRGKPFRPTDSEAVFQMAVHNLTETITQNNAVISHDPLPTISGDEVQLIQLFQNLIGNAVKFHGRRKPQVHISAKRQDAEWVFAIRDNGIGMESDQQERIFSIFQRLHH